LGLSVAQRIVWAHGGRIQVDSEIMKGTTFTVHLPIPPARQACA
jgi:signal transduction histidine kinase